MGLFKVFSVYILSVSSSVEICFEEQEQNTINPTGLGLSKIKTYIKKNRDVYTFEGLEKNVDKAINTVKPENYKNYFKNAYGIKDSINYTRQPSTRKCKLKKYKP